ncbi:alpha/beta-hydrolase, partial [Ramicandelaber brevisporus]
GYMSAGYMSACYAMRYPDRVEKLVLISPAGVPPKPDNYDDIITNGIPQEVVQKREQLTEYYEEQRQQVRPSPKSESAPAPRRKIPSWLISMWENNVTPQSIVRMLGPLGPKLVNYYVSHFRFLSEGEHEDLTSYMYHVTANRGSGEYALSSILLPLAYSRSPLEPRITEPGSLKMPVSFVYGSHDWMDSRAAYRVRNTMPAGQVEVVTIPRAGHNLFLDNPDVFN